MKVKIPEQDTLTQILVDWAWERKKQGITFKNTQELIKCDATDFSHMKKGKRNFSLERLISMLRRTGEFEVEVIVRKKDETL